MKKFLRCITAVIFIVLLLVGCRKEMAPSENMKNSTVHLPMIPIHVKYNNKTYKVIPNDIDIKNVEKEVGITTGPPTFKVFKINNVDTKDAIAILVVEKNPYTTYFKAVEEKNPKD